MKKLLMVVTMAMASVLFAQDKTMSSADARGKIGDIISDPASMTSVMKQLAAADQASFLADVNAAISKMPGSPEEKTSKFVAVNSAALKGAQKGNLTTLVAEVFATVPPESLTAINEQFAAGMFNRAADPSIRMWFAGLLRQSPTPPARCSMNTPALPIKSQRRFSL